MGLRLGFHYHIPASATNECIAMPGYLGCFVDSLAEQCEKVTCFLHSPGPDYPFTGDHELRAGNVELVDIGPHASVPQRIVHAQRYVRAFKTRREELDAILIRGPSPLLPAFAAAAGSLPVVLLLVGNYLAGIDGLPQPRWRKELIRWWSTWNQNRQLDVAKHSLTFVNSHQLYEQMRSHTSCLVETRTTTLSETDFFYREDTCRQPPYRLLYTGRIGRAKGLLEMVAALASLIAQGYDCVLDLVGMPEQGDSILKEIKQKAEDLSIGDKVNYYGYRPLGPQLFEFYRNGDVYLIASQASEGFPRTIWEAMASSLPVVATRVGSIPDFLEGAAELIEPGESEAIAQGVINLLQNPDRRRQYIQAGMLLAQQNTLEQRSVEMVSKIKDFLQFKDE